MSLSFRSCFFFFFLSFQTCLLSREKITKFSLGNTKVSSKITSAKEDSSVFVSYRLLEKIIKDKVLEELDDGTSSTVSVKVKCANNHVIVSGAKGPVSFKIDINGVFYRYKKQKNKNSFLISFTLQVGEDDEGFFKSLVSVVTLPVGMIFESVLSVVFAATHIKAGVDNYLDLDIRGSFTPLAFVTRFGASIVNLFLPSGEKIHPTHGGEVEVKLNQRALDLFSSINNIELGGAKKGILIHFY